MYMAQFRLLTQDELQELKKEFIEFLIVNGIDAPEWEKIKQTKPDEAHQMIELFSDVVFATILRKTHFLEYRDTHHLHLFQCLENEIVLVAMEAPKSEEIDFTNPVFLSSAMLTPPSNVKVYTSQKAYSKNREAELFDMLQNGCVITDDKLFKALCLAL